MSQDFWGSGRARGLLHTLDCLGTHRGLYSAYGHSQSAQTGDTDIKVITKARWRGKKKTVQLSRK